MTGSPPDIDMAWSGLPRIGERVSGDLVLLAARGAPPSACVVDVAGHGPVAHAAAERIREANPLATGGEVTQILRAIHAVLTGSGAIAAAMALRVVEQEDGRVLEYCGVGNVRIAFSSRAPGDEGRPGMVGEVLPTLHVQRQPLRRGDMVAVFSDGVSGDLALLPEHAGMRLRDVPSLLLRRHGRRYDDATCLVLRAESP